MPEPVSSKAPSSTTSPSVLQKIIAVKASNASSTPASNSPPSAAQSIKLSPIKLPPTSATPVTTYSKDEDDTAISSSGKSPTATVLREDEEAAIDGEVSLETTAASNLPFGKNLSNFDLVSDTLTSRASESRASTSLAKALSARQAGTSGKR